MKRLLLSAVASVGLSFGSAHAQGVLVHDQLSFMELFQQLQQAVQMVSSLEQQVNILENVPRQMIGQVEGLISQTIRNPLNDIMGNLNGLRLGSGPGSCSGSQNFLAQDQFYMPTNLPSIVPLGAASGGVTRGLDFLGSLINNRANSTAGVLACNQQMMTATQQRMDDMQTMVDQLKACNDITCINGVNGQIAVYQATIQNQQLQATLVGQHGDLLQRTREQNELEYVRAAEAQAIQETGGAGAAGSPDNVPVAGPTVAAPTFGAGLANGVGG